MEIFSHYQDDQKIISGMALSQLQPLPNVDIAYQLSS